MFDLRSRKAAAMVVVVDFLLAVLLMQQAVLSLTTINKSKTPPRIETLGIYVVRVTWPEGLDDDVDLYVQDPEGNTVFYASNQSGLMHLERDDLGDANDQGLGGVVNQERVIIRGTLEGEYTVNVHMYSKNSPDAVPVKVELYRLRGDDKVVLDEEIILRFQGDEQTAFRFSLNKAQQVTDINHLSKDLVVTNNENNNGGWSGGPPSYP